MTTFDSAVGHDLARALDLYQWNADLAAALVKPLHICEVTVRNAVSNAIESAYNDPRWPWSAGFLRSLPQPKSGFDAAKELSRVSATNPTTGKVIAELKFVFWQSMFTRRHDHRIWNLRLRQVIPNLDAAQPVRQQVAMIAARLEGIRILRNRVAHHEPVFARDLAHDLANIIGLVEFVCADTATWLRQTEDLTAVLARRP